MACRTPCTPTPGPVDPGGTPARRRSPQQQHHQPTHAHSRARPSPCPCPQGPTTGDRMTMDDNATRQGSRRVEP
eukprot:6905781-Lingulodinium_polyedra.AAC.1